MHISIISNDSLLIFCMIFLYFVSNSCSSSRNDIFRYTPPFANDEILENERVIPANHIPPQKLKILTINLWGAKMVGDHDIEGTKEIIQSLKRAEYDIIGLQEDGNKSDILASSLGFYHTRFENGKSLLSRYPIIRSERLVYGTVALLALDEKFLFVASLHLPASPYGPYLSCFENKSPQEVEDNEYQVRGKELFYMLEQIEKKFIQAHEKKIPIVIMGDLNTPSHIDWPMDRENLSKKNCQWDHFYPVTKMLEDYHFQDTYRFSNPNIQTHPGYTWSPIVKVSTLNEGEAEPQDRIDYIFKRGSLLQIQNSYLVAIPLTDHFGVSTEFGVLVPALQRD